jgi:hypothetical protein
MTDYSTAQYPPVNGVNVNIVVDDKVLALDYQGTMTEHKGSLWWGTAVGYRAMQMAAIALSDQHLWRQENLVVVSGHPGPGVIDALNYVTKCSDNDRCTVIQNPRCENRCNSEMKFEWWVSDGKRTAHVMLREDFVPEEFYKMIDRMIYDGTTDEDRRLFELFKVNLSARIWAAPLEESFKVQYCEPLAKGELPTNSDWSPIFTPEAQPA